MPLLLLALYIWGSIFHDVVLTPMLAFAPPQIGTFTSLPPAEDYELQCRFTPYTSMVNVMGLPAVSVPVLRDAEGLSWSVQAIGRPGTEGHLLALAARLEVSEAALYRHFASKAQMFEGLIEFIEQSVFTLINQITEREPEGPGQAARIVAMLVQFAEKNPGMTRVMVGDALVFRQGSHLTATYVRSLTPVLHHELVGAGAVVTEGKVFPERSLILGAPAKAVRTLSDEEVANLQKNASGYAERAARYKTQLVAL